MSDNRMKEIISDRFTRSVLFPVIRKGMGLSDDSVSLSENDCAVLYQLGRMQSILSILNQGIKNTDISEEWREKFKAGSVIEAAAYVYRNHSLKTITDIFENAGITYIPLKGSVIRDLYPEPWMRTSSDIDILIHEEDVDQAVDLLETKTDFKSRGRNYHDISLLNNIVHLELHFSIKENADNIDTLLSRAWVYAEPSGKGTMYRFSPEYLIFHIIAHMSYHMVHGGLGIRPFLDLWLLRKKTDYDETIVRKYCEQCGILKFYEMSCDLSEVWLGEKPHTETTGILEEYSLKGGVFGTAELSGAGSQREHKGIHYLFYRLFIRKSVLQEMYPLLKEKPYLTPIYQLKRWLRLLDKNKRKQVTSEVERIFNTSPESIASFDKLLKSLGL